LYADLPPTNEVGVDVLRRAGSVSDYARALAVALEKGLPDLVVSDMKRELRHGKVLVDWSQNNPAKTTITPWSLRGREEPTAAVPVTWAEVERGGLRQRTMQEAVALVAGA